jgi:hypothetical protein
MMRRLGIFVKVFKIVVFQVGGPCNVGVAQQYSLGSGDDDDGDDVKDPLPNDVS